MSRLSNAIRLDMRLQKNYGFYHATVFVTLVWLAITYFLPTSVHRYIMPLIIFLDLGVIGFYFIGGMQLFEKGEQTSAALVVTPLKFYEYLAAKVVTLTLLALASSLTLALVLYGVNFNVGNFLAGVVLTSIMSLLIGYIAVTPFSSISSYILPSTFYLFILALPIFYYFQLSQNWLFYLLPTQGGMLFLGAMFSELALGQVVYALVSGVVWILVLAVMAKYRYQRHILPL